MNDFNDINTIIEDYPFDEDNPFLMEIPSYETVYRKDELINNENESGKTASCRTIYWLS